MEATTSLSRTNDGLLSLLDSDENVVETVDPLGVQ